MGDLKEVQAEVSLWGKTQEELEQQALQELQLFSDENKKSKNSGVSLKQPFDITGYLKNQEDLRRQQESIKKSKSKIKNVEAIKHDNIVKVQNDLKVKEVKPVSNKKSCKRKASFKDDEENNSDSEYIPSDNDSDYHEGSDSEHVIKLVVNNQNKKFKSTLAKCEDDGCMQKYKSRLDELDKMAESGDEEMDDNSDNKGFKIPKKTADKLFSYQIDGVNWLYQMFKKGKGALLGDEMGLGKTVQIIAFFHSLDISQIRARFGLYRGLGPTLIVVPTTLLQQWVQHFHYWAPNFRVAVLHASGTYKGDKKNLINEINTNNQILVTTYSTVSKYFAELAALKWHFVVLDEGHKIRNPSAQITKMLKQIKALYRIILTGSPMQNNLKELWSLFDYINPGMLGTIHAFLDHFADPITKGGYINASPMQEAIALAMAKALQAKILSCMLRRTKDTVQKHINLPVKTEQVLFCSITEEQKKLYKDFLMTDEVEMCLGKSKSRYSQNQMQAHIFVAIQQMRKICNHPDLFLSSFEEIGNEESTKIPGDFNRSGKMQVVNALLKIWKQQGHRVLLFTQSRGMISIFQQYLTKEGFKFLKMDGGTNVASRQTLIDNFNNDPAYFVFLLTTKVGGLGLNLIGANRVIIYDPDWNPATDIQARERAWRIGQCKDVTIFRLLSAGTIEEKIYRRQVYKQLLAKKVLVDPTVQKLFRTSDLYDIFSLQEEPDTKDMRPENIFRKQRLEVQKKLDEKNAKKLKRKKRNDKIDLEESNLFQVKNKQHKSVVNKSFDGGELSEGEIIDDDDDNEEVNEKGFVENRQEENWDDYIKKQDKNDVKFQDNKNGFVENKGEENWDDYIMQEKNDVKVQHNKKGFVENQEEENWDDYIKMQEKNDVQVQDNKKGFVENQEEENWDDYLKMQEINHEVQDNIQNESDIKEYSQEKISGNYNQSDIVSLHLESNKQECNITEEMTITDDSQENQNENESLNIQTKEGILSNPEEEVEESTNKDIEKSTNKEIEELSNKVEESINKEVIEDTEINSQNLKEEIPTKIELSAEKIKEMRALAQKIARSVSLGQVQKKSEKKASGKPSKSSKKTKKKSKVDFSGSVDGHKVDGLEKIEFNKMPKEEVESQEDYILEKLFNCSGVQMSINYDNPFKTISKKKKSLSVEYEATLKADLAIQALEKSVHS